MQIKPNKQKVKLPKITQEKIQLILNDIEKGIPKKYAAEANGISRRHLHYMIQQGVCDLEHEEMDTIHSQLVLSLRKIEKNYIKSCIDDIRKNEKGHKGAQWILEHAYWREFCGDAKLMELAKEIDMEKEYK